jgi:lipoprotein-anchoring transpeptidase ErfK/SrfK
MARRVVPCPRRAIAASMAAILALAAGADVVAHGPPWIGPGAPALPEGVRSARVLLADQHVFAAPAANAPKRGTIARDVRLPIFSVRRGSGCRGSWLGIGPLAWICEEAVELSAGAPIEAKQRTIGELRDGLPFRYFFVGPDGSFAYKRIESVDVGAPDMQLEPGFAVAIVAEQSEGGARYGRTGHDLWVPMRDLGAVHAFAFRGVEIPPGVTSIPVAWVVVDKARVLSKPSAAAITSESRARFEAVPALEEVKGFAGGFLRIGEGAWLASKDVRHPSIVEPPPEVDEAAGERWIDVEIATQTLVAYEGKKPVFATLVSTGKGREGTALATPRGTHRTWVKLLASDMDNLEDENAARYYRMEDVPYVQYFSKGVGLHGAFWHRSFGHVRSHGCVNLSPLDAQRLFWWTAPHLPAGWTAVFPTAHEPGTVVRVR